MPSLTAAETIIERERVRKQPAVMYTETTPGGSVTVRCPYCLISGLVNPVDITKFADSDGKRECKTSCSKGHTLVFKTIAEWREKRQRLGIQNRG